MCRACGSRALSLVYDARVADHVYQLVLQLPDTFFASIGELHAFEERLMARLPRTAKLDGHDIGSGTINVFVDTDFPEATFATIRSRVTTRVIEAKLRIAYRAVDSDDWVNLWPRRDPRPFALMYGAGADPFARGAKRVIPKRTAARTPAQKAVAKVEAAKAAAARRVAANKRRKKAELARSTS